MNSSQCTSTFPLLLPDTILNSRLQWDVTGENGLWLVSVVQRQGNYNDHSDYNV